MLEKFWDGFFHLEAENDVTLARPASKVQQRNFDVERSFATFL